MASAPIYGRSTLEIWIDEAATAESNALQWEWDWRNTPGGAAFHREYVLSCQDNARGWMAIADFCFAEAAKMEADPRYSPDGFRLMAMAYRMNRYRR